MTEIAEAARGLPDARVRLLVDWIRAHMCPRSPPGRRAQAGRQPETGKRLPPWTETRLLIFTEYDDTKRYLREQLAAAIGGTDRADERIAVFHGPTPDDEREEIKRAFNGDPARTRCGS